MSFPLSTGCGFLTAALKDMSAIFPPKRLSVQQTTEECRWKTGSSFGHDKMPLMQVTALHHNLVSNTPLSIELDKDGENLKTPINFLHICSKCQNLVSSQFSYGI
jgi:hypothetical protein